MRWSVALALTVSALLAACGPKHSGPPPGAVDDAVLDSAPWEREWATAELDTWRDLQVVEFPANNDLLGHDTKPFVGANVELLAPTPDGRALTRVGAPGVTGADGRVRLGPGPSDGWVMHVTSLGWIPACIGGGTAVGFPGVVTPRQATEVRVGLRRPSDLSARVLDETKRPVAGARVVASSPCYAEELTTDADGRFVAHAPADFVLVEVRDPRFEHVPLPVNWTSPDPKSETSVIVRTASPLRGKVVSTDDDAPLAGAVVLCVEDPSVRTRTDAAGRFELAVARRLHVAAFAGGYAWREYPLPQAGEIEMRISPTAGVTGRVADLQDRPVADARLLAVVVDHDGMRRRILGPRTRADGSFDFAWIAWPARGATAATRLVAVKRGFGESEILALDHASAKSQMKVVLHGSRDVSGRAANADGSPAVGATIEARWGHWDGGVAPPEVEVLGLAESAFARVDSQGRWHLPRVPLSLHARIRCSRGGDTLEKEFDIAPADAPLDFAFLPGLPIAGHLVDARGKPIEGTAQVEATLLNAQGTEVKRRVTANPDGTFRFDELPPGEYQLQAWGNAYDLVGGEVVKAGDTSAVVKLPRSATVTFHFQFEGGAAPDVPLTLDVQPQGGGALRRRVTIPAGKGGEGVPMVGLVPGTWTLDLAGDVWRAAIEKIEIGDGEIRTVDVAVRRTLRVTGKVVEADGTPPAERVVVVVAPLAPTTGVPRSVTSGDGGIVDLTGLTPGRWRATSDPVNAASMSVEFEVKEGATAPIELRLPAHGRIDVHVADGEGNAVKDAIVVLTDAAGAPVNGWGEGPPMTNHFRVNAEGRAVLRGVPVGRVRVEVRSGSEVLKKADVDVVAKRTTAVDVP